MSIITHYKETWNCLNGSLNVCAKL